MASSSDNNVRGQNISRLIQTSHLLLFIDMSRVATNHLTRRFLRSSSHTHIVKDLVPEKSLISKDILKNAIFQGLIFLLLFNSDSRCKKTFYVPFL